PLGFDGLNQRRRDLWHHGRVHELGLLKTVVTAVEKAVADTDAPVEAVGLRVGALSGAVPEALLGSWPIAIAGTRLVGARLDIEVVAAQIWCSSCDAAQEVDEFFALTCPACGLPCGNLIGGREFEVAFADVADGPTGTS
ncbi:MAG: hydrogenase maturation nickel metallochaperone HypA, partial [Propionibacteriales bacterium]|nr:hydrogenase maturation nickel metallochaperone HypA [Propionibacteriales bacterium]